jgi:ADP-ribosyl-[dinitrogen reductase] hydrolase
MPSSTLGLETRLRGLLLGGALQTPRALSIDMRRDGLTGAFGPNGLEEYAWAQDYLGAIEDYSPLILFTLEGLLRVQLRRHEGRAWSTSRIFDHAVRHWWTTLTYHRLLADLNGFLWDQDALWPECTEGKGFPQPVAKAAGSIPSGPTRACVLTWVAPVGVLSCQPSLLAREMAHFVDARPTVVAAAGWYAVWIAHVAAGAPIHQAAQDAMQVVQGLSPKLDAVLAKAFRLVTEEASQAEFGAGFEAEEAAAHALWCVLTAAEPLAALKRAGDVVGDSETVVRLVGQVLGTAYGDAWIPDVIEPTSLREVIYALAADAVRVFTEVKAGEDEGLRRRYPTY